MRLQQQVFLEVIESNSLKQLEVKEAHKSKNALKAHLKGARFTLCWSSLRASNGGQSLSFNLKQLCDALVKTFHSEQV